MSALISVFVRRITLALVADEVSWSRTALLVMPNWVRIPAVPTARSVITPSR